MVATLKTGVIQEPSSGTANLTLDASGGVTVGQNLTVAGTTTFTGGSTFTGNATAAAFIPSGSTVPTNGLYRPAVNTVGLATNSTNALYIDSSQNVGIGTSSPAYKLDVNSNANINGTAVMSSPYTMRNKIINGAMQIAQRGTSVSVVSGGYSYAIDRFFLTINSGSSGFTASQLSQASTGLTGFYSALRFQRNAGQTSTTNQAVGQTIETANCQDLQGQSVVLSFYARAGSNFSAASSQITARIATGTGVDEGTNGAYNGTWTGYAQTQSTITLTTSWQRFTVTASIGSSVNEIQILFYWAGVGTAGANDYVDITGVQLERGTVATPFEYRNYQQELAMCQRYFQRWDSSTNLFTPLTTFIVTAGSRLLGLLQYKVTMRSAPTITSSAAGTFASASGSISVTGIGFIGYANYLFCEFSCAATANGFGAQIESSNTLSAFINSSAEL